ncbi:MAG: hypothetical protein ACXWH0_14830 [Acidimicrobiia bacterium]
MHFHRALTRLPALYGRFVGIAVLLYGGWIFAGNAVVYLISDTEDSPAVVLGILATGLLGFLSAVSFLLTFDGPIRWRDTKRRAAAWVGMFLCSLLPSSLITIVLPLVVLAALTILVAPEASPTVPVT